MEGCCVGIEGIEGKMILGGVYCCKEKLEKEKGKKKNVLVHRMQKPKCGGKTSCPGDEKKNFKR